MMESFPTLPCSRVKPFFAKQKSSSGYLFPLSTRNLEKKQSLERGDWCFFSMQKWSWGWGSSWNRIQTNADIYGRKSKSVALFTDRHNKSEWSDANRSRCVLLKLPQNRLRAMIDFSLQSIYIYVFSAWSSCSLHRDTQRCSSKQTKTIFRGRSIGKRTGGTFLFNR